MQPQKEIVSQCNHTTDLNDLRGHLVSTLAVIIASRRVVVFEFISLEFGIFNIQFFFSYCQPCPTSLLFLHNSLGIKRLASLGQGNPT